VDRLNILAVPGVVNFVFWLGKPAVVRDLEIAAIREFIGNYPKAYSRSISVVKGEEVEVKVGQLKNKKGIVEEVRNQTVIVRLEGLGFELLAEVRKVEIMGLEKEGY
jgi:transcription antitermination factor NusG